jgi:hypothetical protein
MPLFISRNNKCTGFAQQSSTYSLSKVRKENKIPEIVISDKSNQSRIYKKEES